MLVAAGIGVAGLVAAACGTGSDDDKKDTGPKKPKVSVAYTPDLASPDAPNPTDEFSVKASKGTFNPDVKLLNPQGVAVRARCPTTAPPTRSPNRSAAAPPTLGAARPWVRTTCR